jgi:uracil-DNA glycosylase
VTAAAWRTLSARITACTACEELAATRTSVVVGVLPPAGAADLVLVGEAPGADEDAAGLPFVGRSGRLLDRLLGEAGVDRGEVAVLNVLKCRPPGNRAPRVAEVTRCRPWLRQQLLLVDARVIVALGSTAVRWFLGPGARLTELRGGTAGVPWPDGGRGDGGPVLVFPTYHPSAALRFGPAGPPMAALREDLAAAATAWRAMRGGAP